MTVRGRMLVAGSWVACHLPERSAFRVAGLIGDLWYRVAPARAAQARRNLRRVCIALAASGRGSPEVQAAATDPKARAAYQRMGRAVLGR